MCQRVDFDIGDIALIGFYSGDYILVHVISGKLQLMGEIPLREVLLSPEFYEPAADQILFS